MSRIAGLVGCKAGWYVLKETPLPGPWHWSLATTFEEAMRALENYDVIAIDVPLSSYDVDLSNNSIGSNVATNSGPAAPTDTPPTESSVP